MTALSDENREQPSLLDAPLVAEISDYAAAAEREGYTRRSAMDLASAEFWDGLAKTLKAARSALAARSEVPEGFVLVPVEPTTEMLRSPDDAGVGLYSREVFVIAYRAMLAARPGGSVGAPSLTAPDAWQPISTAPSKSRTPVLLIGRYPTGTGWTDIYHSWSQAPYGDDFEVHWSRWPHRFPPSHWQPVTTPVEPKGDGAPDLPLTQPNGREG